MYIANPHLIDGYKYDMRLYVLVTSYDPLIIYMYKEGIIRFAAHKYDNQNYQDMMSHLTNYSINKFSEEFVHNEGVEMDGIGNKWSMKALLSKYQEMRIDTRSLFNRIKDVIVKTLIASSDSIT